MKRILFIDVRNTVRSPMAEAWFNHLAKGWGCAYSAGTMPGDQIDPLVVQVMSEAGFDLEYQTPQTINQQMLGNADVVVIMGTDIFPQALSPTRIWDFQDPARRPIESYRALRDAIRVRVEELISEIRQDTFEPYETDWQIPLMFLQHLTLNQETLRLLAA